MIGKSAFRQCGFTLVELMIAMVVGLFLLGGGLLGIYLIGFFSDRGDARSIWCGIACTFAFTLWTVGAFPESWTVPFDTYYTAAIGNVVMVFVGYGLARLVPARNRDLTGLTVWQRGGD